METQPPLLTNQEKYELKRQEKIRAQEVALKKNRFKEIAFWFLGIILIEVAIGGIDWYIATRPPILESDIVSYNGLHWHADLQIYVKGVKQEIPKGIGLSGTEMGVHTHEADNVVHMEFNRLVKKEDLRLGSFFKSWGKDMGSLGTNIKMTVNGKENTEYENYIMQDKDKIELQFK